MFSFSSHRYFILVSLFLFTGCRTSSDENNPKPGLQFRLANELKANSIIWDASRLFMEEIKKASPDGSIREGEIEVNFYDQGMVGTERQLLESCYLGVIEAVQVNSSVVTSIDPAYNIFDFPYMFLNEKHHEEVLYGSIGNTFLERLKDKDLIGVTFFGTGFRNMFYKTSAGKPCVETPEDLRGMKIRVMESPTMINAINAMGATATPIPFSELYQSLKTGVVDGAENSPQIFLSYRYDETDCNCFTFTEHFANQHILIVNKEWFENLEPKYQMRISEAARIASRRFNELWDSSTKEAINSIRSLGVEVNQIKKKKAFREAVAGQYDAFFRAHPEVSRDLFERILTAGEKFENEISE